MRRVVAGRATALAVAGVEALREDDELEALEVLEHHRELVPAALLVVVTLALAAPALVQRHQFLRGGSLPPGTAGFRRGEHVQRRVGDLATRRPAVMEELQLEAVVLQAALEPACGRLGGVQLQPAGTGRESLGTLGDPAAQQETPRDRRAEVDQRLEVARPSVIALEEESQGRVIDRDVLRVAGNRDGKVQGVTVVTSPPADVEARLVPRNLLCNEKNANPPMSMCASLCKARGPWMEVGKFASSRQIASKPADEFTCCH